MSRHKNTKSNASHKASERYLVQGSQILSKNASLLFKIANRCSLIMIHDNLDFSRLNGNIGNSGGLLIRGPHP